MIKFKIKEQLQKNNMSRYKLRQYTDLSYKRVNDYYFGRVKNIKTDELDKLCELFNCDISDIVEFKKNNKKL